MPLRVTEGEKADVPACGKGRIDATGRRFDGAFDIGARISLPENC
jgi:hypothetical protein